MTWYRSKPKWLLTLPSGEVLTFNSCRDMMRVKIERGGTHKQTNNMDLNLSAQPLKKTGKIQDSANNATGN